MHGQRVASAPSFPGLTARGAGIEVHRQKRVIRKIGLDIELDSELETNLDSELETNLA